LFSVYSEALQIVVKDQSSIKKFSDLNGKNIIISGSVYPMMLDLIGGLEWDSSSYTGLPPKGVAEWSNMLCSGRVDAFALNQTFPSSWVQAISDQCDIRLVNVTGGRVNTLANRSGVYSKVRVPKSNYVGTKSHTDTIGYKASFVTNTKLSSDDAYAFVKSTFENLETLKGKHHVLSILDPKEMIRDGLPAPLHPGAARYYREQGWIK